MANQGTSAEALDLGGPTTSRQDKPQNQNKTQPKLPMVDCGKPGTPAANLQKRSEQLPQTPPAVESGMPKLDILDILEQETPDMPEMNTLEMRWFMANMRDNEASRQIQIAKLVSDLEKRNANSNTKNLEQDLNDKWNEVEVDVVEMESDEDSECEVQVSFKLLSIQDGSVLSKSKRNNFGSNDSMPSAPSSLAAPPQPQSLQKIDRPRRPHTEPLPPRPQQHQQPPDQRPEGPFMGFHGVPPGHEQMMKQAPYATGPPHGHASTYGPLPGHHGPFPGPHFPVQTGPVGFGYPCHGSNSLIAHGPYGGLGGYLGHQAPSHYPTGYHQGAHLQGHTGTHQIQPVPYVGPFNAHLGLVGTQGRPESDYGRQVPMYTSSNEQQHRLNLHQHQRQQGLGGHQYQSYHPAPVYYGFTQHQQYPQEPSGHHMHHMGPHREHPGHQNMMLHQPAAKEPYTFGGPHWSHHFNPCVSHHSGALGDFNQGPNKVDSSYHQHRESQQPQRPHQKPGHPGQDQGQPGHHQGPSSAHPGLMRRQGPPERDHGPRVPIYCGSEEQQHCLNLHQCSPGTLQCGHQSPMKSPAPMNCRTPSPENQTIAKQIFGGHKAQQTMHQSPPHQCSPGTLQCGHQSPMKSPAPMNCRTPSPENQTIPKQIFGGHQRGLQRPHQSPPGQILHHILNLSPPGSNQGIRLHQRPPGTRHDASSSSQSGPMRHQGQSRQGHVATVHQSPPPQVVDVESEEDSEPEVQFELLAIDDERVLALKSKKIDGPCVGSVTNLIVGDGNQHLFTLRNNANNEKRKLPNYVIQHIIKIVKFFYEGDKLAEEPGQSSNTTSNKKKNKEMEDAIILKIDRHLRYEGEKHDMKKKIDLLKQQLGELLSKSKPQQEVLKKIKKTLSKNKLPDYEVMKVIWTSVLGKLEKDMNEEQAEEGDQILNEVNTYALLFAAFSTSAKAQETLILEVQKHCNANEDLEDFFSKVVTLFYERKIISKDSIMFWNSSAKKRGYCREQIKLTGRLQNASDSSEGES